MKKNNENALIITSLDEYLLKIKENCFNSTIHILREKLDDIWFRGESKINNRVLPSLFRFKGNSIPNNGYYSMFHEQILIEKALQYYPSLFEHCNSAIERLVTMQHYTLPTRLLDVTKSPLVALYFACSGDFEEPGRVLFMKKLWPILDSTTINELAIIAENTSDAPLGGNTIKECLKKLKADKSFIKLFIDATKNYLFIPKYDNDRIKHQQGAVIFSSLFQPVKQDKERFHSICEKFEKAQIDNVIEELCEIQYQNDDASLDNEFETKYFEVPADFKQVIRRELDNCGINEAIVYPEPEHQMQYVKWYCAGRNEIYG